MLWEGAPDPSVVFSKQDFFLIPFSLLWGGFAIFWEIGVSASGWGFGTIWGIPFVLVGLYLIVGRFFYKRWDRRNTSYVLTDRRAVIVSAKGRRVLDADVRSAHMQVERGPGSRGSAIWSLPGSPTWGGSRLGSFNTALLARGGGWPMANRFGSGEVAFLDVPDFDRLFAVIQQLRAAPPSQPSSWPLPPGPPPPPPPPPPPSGWVLPTATLPEGVRPWGRWPSPLLGGLVAFVGIGIIAFMAVFVVHRLAPYLDHPPRIAAPGLTQLKLERGTYVLFACPATQRHNPYQCFAGRHPAPFGPRDVTVIAPTGQRLHVVADITSDRITQHERTYLGVVEFFVPSAGHYQIMVGLAAVPSDVVIDPSPGQEFHAFTGWIALGAGGLLLVLLGIASIVGALVHRQRLRQLRVPPSPLLPPSAPPFGTARNANVRP